MRSTGSRVSEIAPSSVMTPLIMNMVTGRWMARRGMLMIRFLLLIDVAGTLGLRPALERRAAPAFVVAHAAIAPGSAHATLPAGSTLAGGTARNRGGVGAACRRPAGF